MVEQISRASMPLAKVRQPAPVHVADLMGSWRMSDRGKLQFEKIPVPVISQGQVLVEIDAVPILDLDLTMIDEIAATTLRPDRRISPFFPGRTFAGTVVTSLGTSFNSTGQRVLAMIPASASSPWIDGGGLQEFAAVAAEHLVILPDEMSFEEATLMLSVGLIANLLENNAKIEGSAVAAVGDGTSTLIAAALATELGATSVSVYSARGDRLSAARRFGADKTFSTGQKSVQEVLAQSGAPFPDVVIISGDPASAVEAISLLPASKPAVLLTSLNPTQDVDDGWCGYDGTIQKYVPASFDPQALFHRAASLTAAKSGLFRRLHTHSFMLEELPEALRFAREGLDGANHVIVKPVFSRRPPWGGWS